MDADRYLTWDQDRLTGAPRRNLPAVNALRQKGKRGRVNLFSAIFPRAREARHLQRRPPLPFCEIPFCEIAVGGERWRDGLRAIGANAAWSAARCAETHPRSALVGRTGRAELRGRCSMTAGCCAQRHWAQSPSLFIHCGAERRAETYPRSTRSDRRGNGDALTSSLRFSRAREKRGTCSAGRRFLFAKFLFAKLRLGANAGGMDFERSARTLLGRRHGAPKPTRGRRWLVGLAALSYGAVVR